MRQSPASSKRWVQIEQWKRSMERLWDENWARRARAGNSCCDSLKEAALIELVAQLVEQRPFKAWVLGSIPSELTTHNK